VERDQEGARCAQHQDAVAVALCSRCGNFMCAECNANGARPMCSTCDEKTRFVPLAPNAPLAAHVSAAWKVFRAQTGVIIGALSIWLVVSFAGRFVGNLFSGALTRWLEIVPVDSELNVDVEQMVMSLAVSAACNSFIGSLLDALSVVGLVHVVLEALQGRKARISMMFDFARARRAVPLMLSLLAVKLTVDGLGFAVLMYAMRGQHFRAGDTLAMLGAFGHGDLTVTTAALLAQLIFFVLFPVQVFSVPQFVTHGTSAGETLLTAWRVAAGHRVRIVGWWFVSLVALFTGAMACCVGLVVMGPLVLLVWGSLFLSLRAPVNR